MDLPSYDPYVMNLQLNKLRNPPPLELDSPDWYREDGSRKGSGWLGTLPRPAGGVSSELSIGVPIDGKETEIPTMVPSLTKGELNYLLTTPTSKQLATMPDSIKQKAIVHARLMQSQNKSPFSP